MLLGFWGFGVLGFWGARGGEPSVYHRGFRQHEVDAALNAGVDVNRLGFRHHEVGETEREERVVLHRAGGEVEGGAHLRIGAGVVEGDAAVAVRDQPQGDANGQVADVVVLEELDETVFAGGNACEDRSRDAFGAVQGAGDGRGDGVAAVALGETLHAFIGFVQRGDTGGDVAPVQRGDAAIIGKNVPEFGVEFAAAVKAHRAQAEAFLEDLVVLHVDAAGRVAADIRAMNERPGEAQQFPAGEDRLEQVNVVQVHDHAARAVRVVGHQHVALRPIGDRLGAGMHRHPHDRGGAGAVGVSEGLALRGDQGDGEILRLLDEGGVRGAQQDPGHFVHDGLEEIGENFDADGILAHGCGSAWLRIA